MPGTGHVDSAKQSEDKESSWWIVNYRIECQGDAPGSPESSWAREFLVSNNPECDEADRYVTLGLGANNGADLFLSNVVTSTEYESESLPEECPLFQNLRNPFNPLTTVRYGLRNRSHVNLAVHNTPGQ